jgi:hypothetical protein
MKKLYWLFLIAPLSLLNCSNSSNDAKNKKKAELSIVTLNDKNSCGYLFSKDDILVDPATFVNADTTIQNEIEVLFKAAGFVWNNAQQFVMINNDASVPNCRAFPLLYNTNSPQLGYIRYILYNSKFLDSVRNLTGSKYAVLSVLAHELAHHLYGHSFSFGDDRRRYELEADYFSGFMMAKIMDTALPLDVAERALSIFANNLEDGVYPAKQARLLSFADGWTYSKELDSLSCEAKSLLYTDPEKFIERVRTENPVLYRRITQKIQDTLNSKLPEYRQIAAQDTTTHLFAIQMKSDRNLYVADQENKIKAFDEKGISRLSAASITISSERAGSFKANRDFGKAEVEPANPDNSANPANLEASAGKGTYANNMYLDSQNIIWDRLPNGIPYIAGYRKKIK